MKTDDLRPPPPARQSTPDEEFAKLRRRFYTRMRKERTQLRGLIQAMGSATPRPASIVPEIQAFAHRLRGAALVFEFPDLAEGAKAVELSAIASLLRDGNSQYETAVISALRELGGRLSREIGSKEFGAACAAGEFK